MKLLLLTLAFSCVLPVYSAAQCGTYLSIETLIKIKKYFDEAEDSLISCFKKIKDGNIKYPDGLSSRVVKYDSRKKIKFGEICTMPKESITIFYGTQNLIYSVANSEQYLKLKNLIKLKGKKVASEIENSTAYLYAGFMWGFQTEILDKCSENYYRILISNP